MFKAIAEDQTMTAEDQAKGDQDKPKIIVDDDWKAEAQAEKERLADEVDSKAAQTGATPGAGADQPRQLPPASLTTLVSSLVTQAMFALGAVEDPQTKKRYVDLELAKHHIDTLSVLEQKTAGNVTDDEKQLLDKAMYEVRMMFVEIAQRVGAPTS